MYCSNCGKELEEGSKFCRFCGTPVPEATALQTTVTPEPAAESIQPAYVQAEQPAQQEKKPKKKKTGLVIAAVILLLAVALGGGAHYYRKVQAEKEEERQKAQAEQEYQARIDSINEKMDDYAEEIAIAIEDNLDTLGVSGATKLYDVWYDVNDVLEEGASRSFKLDDEHMFEDIIFYKYNGDIFVYYGGMDDQGKRTDVGFIVGTCFDSSRGVEVYSLQAEWENDAPNGNFREFYIYGDLFDKKVGFGGTVKDGYYDGDVTIARSDGYYECVFHDGVPEVISEDGDQCAIGVKEADGSYLYVDKESGTGLWFVQYPH
ncbi:MAG: zinc-ribbon domain-containing protein [Oscillospiraceae bacterium]|nr:zinc-ribbon domain-containing protein [Oscillospiraceae bacterium]